MHDAGFVNGKASPCIFYNQDRDTRVVIHGDDFTILGTEENLEWFRKKIQTKFEIKFRGRMGPDPTDMKSIRILNRIVTWTSEGIEYEADQRHAEIIVQQMGLTPTCRTHETPSTKVDKLDIRNDTGIEELQGLDATQYRALVARGNFLAQDRSDIRFAVKELSRRMAKPRVRDIASLKRFARYLALRPRLVTKYCKQGPLKTVVGWSDSDWAGCPETRKSTSGGVIMIGSHVIRTWSTTQSVIATSSGEAEFTPWSKQDRNYLGSKPC